jgi:hypothetical protein
MNLASIESGIGRQGQTLRSRTEAPIGLVLVSIVMAEHTSTTSLKGGLAGTSPRP